jgi:tyrosyl-DNA phosphodiesterase-1
MTANLIQYDWQHIENTAWVQDFPAVQTSAPSSSSTKSQRSNSHQPPSFSAYFTQFLDALSAPLGLQALQFSYPEIPLPTTGYLSTGCDFSRVKVKLIGSVAGKFEGWDNVRKWGHMRLMFTVREIGATENKDAVSLECQGSSLGHYAAPWLHEFGLSASGSSPESYLNLTRSKRAQLLPPSVSRFKIIFPSLRTVDESVLGRPGAGTMFCRKTQWDGRNFPRQLFHDSNSKRGPILMHSKMIVALYREPRAPVAPAQASSTGKGKSSAQDGTVGDPIGGWCYIGSHNFTPSAWGTISGSSFTPVLNITNYELGIVIPLPAENTDAAADEIACWTRPPRAYVKGVDEPWMQDYHGME